MRAKKVPFSLRRKSFDSEGLKKSSGHPLSGTIGKDLGFLATCFIGFQTLGSIYGISRRGDVNGSGDIGTSPLYVFTGFEEDV